MRPTPAAGCRDDRANHTAPLVRDTARRMIRAMKSLLRIVAPLMGAFLLAGCAGSGDTPMQPHASVCIVSGEPIELDSPTAAYMGHTVHFCCDRCKAKWDGMDDAAKQAKFDALK